MGGAKEMQKFAGGGEQPNIWFVEYLTPNDAYQHGVQELLVTKRTKYQSMTIADTGAYGRALFLDGKIQIAEGDERFYHEPIVHAALVLNQSAKSVLILGGADGGSAREALRWKSIERVVVVDIDGDVVEACKTYLPCISDGAFDDPRCKLLIGDAVDYIDEGTEKFDVIICDLTDPLENSPSLSLFTKEFFQKVCDKLSDDGVLSIQGGPLSLVEGPRLFPRIVYTLSTVFDNVSPFQSFVSTYGSPLALALASKKTYIIPPASDIDELFKTALNSELHVLDGRGVHGLFAVPKCVTRAISAEKEAFTNENTPRAYGKGVLE